MQPAQRLKAVLIAGALVGALLGIGTALSMDLAYDGSLGGSWQQSIVMDLHTYFSWDVSETSFVVTLIFLGVLTVLGLFGAAMGAFFSVLIYKFLDTLMKR